MTKRQASKQKGVSKPGKGYSGETGRPTMKGRKHGPNTARPLIKQKHGGALLKKQKGDPPGPGRPPKLLTTMVKEMKAAGFEQVGPSSMLHAIETMIGLPEEELRRMAADKDAPMAQRIIAKHLSKQSAAMLMLLLDRAHGKPKQQVDLHETATVTHTITFKK